MLSLSLSLVLTQTHSLSLSRVAKEELILGLNGSKLLEPCNTRKTKFGEQAAGNRGKKMASSSEICFHKQTGKRARDDQPTRTARPSHLTPAYGLPDPLLHTLLSLFFPCHVLTRQTSSTPSEASGSGSRSGSRFGAYAPAPAPAYAAHCRWSHRSYLVTHTCLSVCGPHANGKKTERLKPSHSAACHACHACRRSASDDHITYTTPKTKR